MTTPTFAALASATARAIAAVRNEHCHAPDFRPATQVRGSMKVQRPAHLHRGHQRPHGRTLLERWLRHLERDLMTITAYPLAWPLHKPRTVAGRGVRLRPVERRGRATIAS
jgi:hypothetical protein